MSDNQHWAITVSDWTKIDIDNAKLILDQGEKAVKNSIEVSDKITARAFSMLLFLLPVTSTLIGFFINELSKPRSYDRLNTWFFGIILGISIYCVYRINRLVFPRMFLGMGREPQEIAIESILITELTPDQQKLSLVLNEIDNCQRKITYNEDQNKERITDIKEVITIIWRTFVVALISYVSISSVVKFLSWLVSDC